MCLRKVKVLTKEKIFELTGGKTKVDPHSCFQIMKTVEILQRLPKPREYQPGRSALGRLESFSKLKGGKQW